MMRKKLWNQAITCISKTNIRTSLNVQISLQLKETACRPEWAVAPGWLTENMAPTRELSVETMERIIKLLKEGNSTRSVVKDVGCFQSAVSKIWSKYTQNGKVVKGKHTGRSKRQDRKLKARCLENRQCTRKEMKNKRAETGVNVCDQNVRNRLKEMGFTYRKAKR